MNRIKQFYQIFALMLGAVVVVATSHPDPVIETYLSEEWVAENLYDGQTAVAEDIHIRLTVGTWDFDPQNGSDTGSAIRGVARVRLYPADDENSPVSFNIEMHDEDCVLIPDRLKADTEYVLELSGLEENLESERVIPNPIHFRTGSLPRVTGLWRNGDTLLISFSEPMNPDDLFLGFGAVDIFWQDQDELLSIVSNLNLADFAVQVDTNLFMVAPIDFVDSGWVKISGLVRGMTNVTLDGNNDGAGDGIGDDYVEAVFIDDLPECYTRIDIPAPCVNQEDIPEDWRTGEW